jgi:hypothetical protein
MNEPWISPLGSDVDRCEATLEADPTYREARRRRAPYEFVARALIVYRMKTNLSQKELAERAGTSPATIRRLEEATALRSDARSSDSPISSSHCREKPYRNASVFRISLIRNAACASWAV